jgi:hypothetical protein
VEVLCFRPAGAQADAALPYAIRLDNSGSRVLALRDNHLLVRSLVLQACEECRPHCPLNRFNVFKHAEKGLQKADHQTLIVHDVHSHVDESAQVLIIDKMSLHHLSFTGRKRSARKSGVF